MSIPFCFATSIGNAERPGTASTSAKVDSVSKSIAWSPTPYTKSGRFSSDMTLNTASGELDSGITVTTTPAWTSSLAQSVALPCSPPVSHVTSSTGRPAMPPR